MRSTQNGIAFILALLLTATLYGVYQTGQTDEAPPGQITRLASSDSGVDQSTLNTAQQLARLPTTTDERPFAENALRLGSQELDLAFAQAVRDAVNHPPVVTPGIQAIDVRLQDARKQMAIDQADVTRLSGAVSKASAIKTDTDALTDQLDLTKAQLALDQDEVDDASGDLMRAGGDPQARMQAMTEEHDAAAKQSDSTHVNAKPPVEASGVIHAMQSWMAFHQKVLELRHARSMADSLSATFAKQHDLIDASPAAERRDETNASRATLSHAAAAALLVATQRRATDSKTKAGLDKRGDDQREIANVYANWSSVVRTQQRDAANRAFRGLALILAIVFLGVLFDKWIEHLLDTRSTDQRYVHTLGVVTRVSLQVIGALFILLVIFGPPANLGTFLGLAGAGLTVALKDFIIGFFGWFVLMGKNGIRIGDVVEINGVTGEVVELGMFHTMLLETGSWSDSGNPTGRRVRFTNSFAIEGHYINFSTSGQWLWDEVRIVVPPGRDPYPIVEAIQKQVEAATADSVLAAEQQWKGTRRSPLLSALTAAPAIGVKPILGGMEITVRYIAQVADRSELRANLYHTAVDLLGDTAAGVALPSGASPVPQNETTPASLTPRAM